VDKDDVAPVLSVVIPVRNGGLLFSDQLAALAAQEFDGTWEVIVADNGSTDDTVAVARSFDERLPGLQVVDASTRSGHASAVNAAVSAARGRSILFLDCDDVIAPGYLVTMAAALFDSPVVAARLDCESLNPDWVRRSRPSIQTDGIGEPFAFLPSATGGSIGMWKSVFDTVGGSDPSIAVGDDVDLCWRVQLASFSLRFVPDAVVHYRYRDTLIGIFSQGRGYGLVGPVLYRKYRHKGMPRRSWRGVVRFHGGALARLVKARSRADIAECAFLFGFRLGILEGCVRSRVLYL
jgi:glycosyltransferase involved in cell wall biosynthesis